MEIGSNYVRTNKKATNLFNLLHDKIHFQYFKEEFGHFHNKTYSTFLNVTVMQPKQPAIDHSRRMVQYKTAGRYI